MLGDSKALCPERAQSQPSGELPSAEPELFDRARQAVADLRGRGRRRDGTAGEGNTLNLRHGLRSEQLLNLPDIAAWHSEQVAAITADLGGEAALSTLERAAVREAARLELILSSLGDHVFANGLLTGKGKTRAATMTYLKALDRFMKLTSALGMRRRVKRLDDFASAVRAGGTSA